MNILIYAINFSPELTGAGKYSGELTAWLAGRGDTVTVITANPYYPEWKIHAGYPKFLYSSECRPGLAVYRCPLFIPRSPKLLTRILHLASFAFTSFFAVLAQWRWRPDVVVLVVPTLFCAVNALLFARLTGAKCLVHVQDFEVDALFGLSGRAGLLQRCALWLESFMLRRFDKVSTISAGMLQRAEAKGVEPGRLLLFPNWSEVQRFTDVDPDAALLQSLGVPADRQVALYAGNLGDKQGLESIVEAARLLAADTRLYFLVVGEGAGKARMLAQARALELDNIGFTPLLPEATLPALLASAACHLVVQRRGVVDAVLPSKLTNILAVGGNAVITAGADTTLGRLCVDFPGIAVCVEPESPEHLVAGIRQALGMPVPNSVAQDYARRFLEKEEILGRFEKALIGLVRGE